MRKIQLLFILLLLGSNVFGHNPQVSTISIIQHENKKWSVFITAPLYTCQLAIKANFPKLNTDSLDVYATQNIISGLIKNNLTINGSENNKLLNTKIQVAHETTIYFDIEDAIKITEVDFKAFSKLRDHFTVFKIVPLKSTETTYILNSDNNYLYKAKQEEKKKYSGIETRYILIAVAGILFFYLVFKRKIFKKKV